MAFSESLRSIGSTIYLTHHQLLEMATHKIPIVYTGLLLLSFYATASAQSASSSSAAYTQCESFGVDFQDGGSYFQNISSTDPFTFVSIFEGCQNDQANNILVDPNGDEYLCSDTPLQPDDTNELSICPIEKDQMWSGDWSIVILSNNGAADPIAYERDFYLSVGIPVTQTVYKNLCLNDDRQLIRCSSLLQPG